MANSESKKLTVDVIARIDKLEKGMARASQVTNKQFGAMETRAKKFDSVISNVGSSAFAGLAKGAALALAPMLGVAAAINTAKAALTEFGDISDNAKASGLDAEFFQGLAYQASLGGVAMDALSASLAGFARNSGLAVEGKGRMVAALKALNPELLANIQAATSQEQRVRLAADAIAAAGSASEKAALSVALFGDSGAKLADVFSGGASQIDVMAASARKLGIIIDRDLIARADEMGDQFDTATKVMDLQFKQALIDLAPVLIATANLAGGLAAAIGDISEQMQGLAQRGSATLEAELKTIDDRAALKPSTEAPGVDPIMGNYPEMASADASRRAEIQAELRRRAMDQLRIGLAQLPRDTGEGSGDNPATGGTRNEAADAAVRQAEGVAKLIEQYKFEGEQLGRNAQEQELYNALKEAGVTADSASGQAIAAALGPLQAQRDAIAANAEAMKELQGIAEQALGSFIGDLREGKSLSDSLGDALNSILDNVIQIGIQSIVSGLFGGGGGGIGGLLGGLFGFANGGVAAHGRPKMFANGGVSNTAAVFGEAGPEAAVPLPDGRRIPVDLRQPAGSSQPQKMHITVGVSADSAGNLTPFVESVADGRVARAAPSIGGAAVRTSLAQAPLATSEYQARHG